MIVTRLCGGLGNQLFQYAVGRQLAISRQAELVIDLQWFKHHIASNTPRVYELDHYPIKARLPGDKEVFWCRLNSDRFLRRIPFLPKYWNNYCENGFGFDHNVLNLPDNTYIDGYWQSYKYFSDIKSQIRKELTPIKNLFGKDKVIEELIISATRRAVSLHVRRGDYVTNSAAARTHGTCTLDYYYQAIKILATIVKQPHFFVFSDDIPWVRRNMQIPGDVTFVDHNGPKTAYRDLQLMSFCDHHILANSSFSWWGAWLRSNDGGCVIAPSKWFVDGRDTKDLTPHNWIRI